MASHRAIMKDTVEKDRSPPDSERVSLATRLVPLSTFTWKNKTSTDDQQRRGSHKGLPKTFGIIVFPLRAMQIRQYIC